MATVRQLLRCEVCGAVTLLRTQIGWLDQHPIRVHCGRCNILVSGIAEFDQHNAKSQFRFDNATRVTDVKPDYYLEASGELLTEKLQPYDELNPVATLIPPFFHAAFGPMADRLEEFQERTQVFLKRRTEWPKVRRINELFRNGNHQYLAQEAHRFVPEAEFPMDNQLEVTRALHSLNMGYFNSLFDRSEMESTIQLINSTVNHLEQQDATSLFALATSFNDGGFLDHYEFKVFERMDQFNELFAFMIPIFSLHFYKEIPSDVASLGKGITTASFEDVKQFYFDSFEVLADIARLPLAYTNLVQRQDHQMMANLRKDCKTLDDWDILPSKVKRLDYIDGNGPFDRFVRSKMDHQLRNAIGHNSYRYDGASQLLSFSPNGRRDSSSELSTSLLEVIKQCWGVFHSFLQLYVLVYKTRLVYYKTKGLTLRMQSHRVLRPLNRQQRRAAARKR